LRIEGPQKAQKDRRHRNTGAERLFELGVFPRCSCGGVCVNVLPLRIRIAENGRGDHCLSSCSTAASGSVLFCFSEPFVFRWRTPAFQGRGVCTLVCGPGRRGPRRAAVSERSGKPRDPLPWMGKRVSCRSTPALMTIEPCAELYPCPGTHWPCVCRAPCRSIRFQGLCLCGAPGPRCRSHDYTREARGVHLHRSGR
jgi:hypothetical protein